MISGLDARGLQFMADLRRIQERQERVERAVGSGLRVNRSSDAPERVIDILQLRSEAARTEAVGVNLDRATAEVNTAEAAVRVMVNIVERARVLATQAATATASNRPAIATEVKLLHEQIVNIARTSSEGRYIFSGDNDQEPLYEFDWSQPGGVRQLSDPANTRLLEDVNGSRFSINRSATEILNSSNPSENVFNALYSLATALENSDNDAARAGAENAVGLLTGALNKLGRDTTFYGNAQNRVRDAITLNKEAVIARRQELGQAQDIDIAEALVEMSLSKVHYETALNAQSQLRRNSLFDFLG